MAADYGCPTEPEQHRPIDFPAVSSLEHLDNISEERKQSYANQLCDLGTCDPYTAPAAVFTSLKTTTSLPELDFGDVFIYFVDNPSPYTAAGMKAHKSTDSYKYFQSGWVNDAAVWEVGSQDKKVFIVKAKVNHSSSADDPPLTAWVAVENEGLVRFGHCTCVVAGLGVCAHVGAILYALLAAVNKLSGTACFEEDCSWNDPSMAAIRTVGYAEGSQIEFTKAQRKRSADGCGNLPPAKIQPPTQDECKAFYKMLQTSEDTEEMVVKSSILAVVPGHAERYIPQAVQQNIPASPSKTCEQNIPASPSKTCEPRVCESWSLSHQELSHEELQDTSEYVFTGLTEEQINAFISQ